MGRCAGDSWSLLCFAMCTLLCFAMCTLLCFTVCTLVCFTVCTLLCFKMCTLLRCAIFTFTLRLSTQCTLLRIAVCTLSCAWQCAHFVLDNVHTIAPRNIHTIVLLNSMHAIAGLLSFSDNALQCGWWYNCNNTIAGPSDRRE